ncbi:hypothetical protein FRC04_005136 [Tulasnella sp. 424]|nr:hypothetical protein FRC04_005136 [Tulasnella sp. 424]
MLDFTESHSKALLNSPWLCKIYEVLESRHISRRAVQCGSSTANVDYDEEAEKLLGKRNITLLHNLHRPEAIADADLSVSPSTRADLEVTLSSADFTWRWDAMSLGNRQSAKLLSVHLITPLISFAAMSTFIDEPLREISAPSLTRAADSQAKTAKRSIARQTLGCISKPMVASTLQRMSQIIDDQPNHSPIIVSEEDYAVALPVPPMPPATNSKGKRRRSTSGSPRRHSPINDSPKPLFHTQSYSAAGSQPASLPRSKVADAETEDEDESPGGPSQPIGNDASGQSPKRLSKASSPISAQSSPPPAKVARPAVDSDEDSDAAEARRRAAITKITQSKAAPAIKAPTKKRRF